MVVDKRCPTTSRARQEAELGAANERAQCIGSGCVFRFLTGAASQRSDAGGMSGMRKCDGASCVLHAHDVGLTLSQADGSAVGLGRSSHTKIIRMLSLRGHRLSGKSALKPDHFHGFCAGGCSRNGLCPLKSPPACHLKSNFGTALCLVCSGLACFDHE